MCGGTRLENGRQLLGAGLSPRVRGNPTSLGSEFELLGSIPACAGEPLTAARSRDASKVYPRVCGGTAIRPSPVCQKTGLSPRVRGTRGADGIKKLKDGSIPACAGEPPTVGGWKTGAKVYPRVCGGTTLWRAADISENGLSPRVRGNPHETCAHGAGVGSIPACAGEPRCRCGPARGMKVYPRVCGGTRLLTNSVPLPSGLSPRVRGNLPCLSRFATGVGSIPACAGEPDFLRDFFFGATVYPRVCGGTCSGCLQMLYDDGLSPRVRGNRFQSFS